MAEYYIHAVRTFFVSRLLVPVNGHIYHNRLFSETVCVIDA